MKTTFLIFVFAHALLHLLGFVKAFGLSDVKGLTKSISKLMGLAWLISFLCFAAFALFYLLKNEYWWVFGIIAILLSQILIVLFWKVAKFGTIVNIIVLLAILPAYGNYNFGNRIKKEQKELIAQATPPNSKIITPEDLKNLPNIVQKWLIYSQVINKPEVTFLRLKQKGSMKIKPDGKWMPLTANQYFDVQKPSFIWNARVEMMPLIYLDARDQFKNGEGEMLIKLLSLINVANQGHNEKMNSASMIRYLSEMSWFPSAVLNDYIKWEEIDALSAKATMTWNKESVSGIFRFKENGEMKSFEAQRYFGGEANAKKETWMIETLRYKEFDGYRIPNKCKVIWKLKKGDFNWLNLEVTHFEVNRLPTFSLNKSHAL